MKDDLKLHCSNCGNVLQDTRFKMIKRSTGAVKNLCAFCTDEELNKLRLKRKDKGNYPSFKEEFSGRKEV